MDIVNKPLELTSEQQEEVDRIENHIKALYVGYNNMITLLNESIEADEIEFEEDEEPKKNKLGRTPIKTYAQGVGELAEQADSLFEKITAKKGEKDELLEKYLDVPKKENKTQSTIERSHLSKHVKG